MVSQTKPTIDWKLIVAIAAALVAAFGAYTDFSSKSIENEAQHDARIAENEARLARMEFVICLMKPNANVGPCRVGRE